MSLFRLFEILRSPDDGTGGGASTITATPAVTLPLAGPLTVAPDAPAVIDAAPAPAPAVEAPAAPAAEAPPVTVVAEPAPAAKTESEPSLMSGAKGKEALKTTPAPSELPAPAITGDQPKAGDQPAEGKTDPGAVPAIEAKVEPQPKAKKTYEAFKIPDGVTFSEAAIKEFTDILTSDPEDVISQATAQRLFDKHVSEVQRTLAADRQASRAHWTKLNDGWKGELRSDPRIGGARLETSLAIAKAVIEDYAASKDDANLIFAQLDANGMGNFPPYVRMMHNLGSPEVLNVFEDSIVPAHAPSHGAPRSRTDKWYGDSPKQA